MCRLVCSGRENVSLSLYEGGSVIKDKKTKLYFKVYLKIKKKMHRKCNTISVKYNIIHVQKKINVNIERSIKRFNASTRHHLPYINKKLT